MKLKSTILLVKDLSVARRFWQETFPLTIREDLGPCLSYEEGLSLWDIAHARERMGGDHPSELYFESPDPEAVQARAMASGGTPAHPVTEQPWGQRAGRFFDPDGHLVEVGEPPEVFVGRMSGQGMSPEEIAVRTGYTVDQVLFYRNQNPETRPVTEAGYPELLALQKLCYRREALLYNDFSIPPLTQTPESLQQELSAGTEALGLYLGNRLVGSARGYLKGGTVHIGRVIVHPDHWKKGWGRRILEAMEQHFSGAVRAELFTGSKSRDNVRFYSGCGYEIFKTGLLGDNITLLYFTKDLG